MFRCHAFSEVLTTPLRSSHTPTLTNKNYFKKEKGREKNICYRFFFFFFPFRERLTSLFDVSSVLLFLSALSLFCTTQSVFLKPLQMEEYVTETLLKQTSCRAPYPNLVLRCVVLSTVPLRTCEFSDEKVFTAVGSIAASSPDRGSACGDTVRVNFYGSWGTAVFASKSRVRPTSTSPAPLLCRRPRYCARCRRRKAVCCACSSQERVGT